MSQTPEYHTPDFNETPRRSRARTAILRAGIAGGMALAFVLAASLIEPGASRASEQASSVVLPEGVSRDIPAIFYQVDSSSDLGRSLGELDGRKFRIEIVSGRGGEPETYRVLDANGSVVADGLRANEVYSVDPDLTIDRMGDFPELESTLTGEPLMLLESSLD